MQAATHEDLIRAACDTTYVGELWRNSDTLDAAITGAQLLSAQIVRHKVGKRCLIRYSGIDDSGSQFECLGKIRFRGLDKTTPALQRQLRAAGFDGAQGFSVPRVYGELPSLNMWLQEFMLGESPLSVESGEFVAVQVSVAQALAKLHTTSIACTKYHTLVDEQALLEFRFQQLGQCRPKLSKALADLQMEMARASRQFTSSNLMTTIHRDFYFDQALLSSTQTVLVDLDLCCLGPPELDVGNYVGHLREYAIRCPAYQETCRAAEDVFRRTYFNSVTYVNWPAVEFWTNLTLARHIFLSTQLPGRSHTTIGLLNLARFGFAGLVST